METLRDAIPVRIFILTFVLYLFFPSTSLPVTADHMSPPPVTSEARWINRMPPALVRYKLDPAQSKFTVKALAGGLLSAFAHDHNIAIQDFSGAIDLTPVAVIPATMQMTIQARSLAIVDNVSEKDRNEIQTTMRTAVLEVEKYPEITFKSTNISAEKTSAGQYEVQIWGDLSLHGVSKSIWFKAVASVSDHQVRARGSFTLRQSDFKIKPPTVAGGTIKVKDELKFAFDIVGVR